MQAYRIEMILAQDGIITLNDLPFQEGETVEVIVLPFPSPMQDGYPLRGKPVAYLEPAEPVACEDWEALR